jgi:hypothetical protein
MWITLFAALSLSLSGVYGAVNITVDNTDTSISYTGFWEVTSLGGYDYNGTQNLIDLGDNMDRPGSDSTATFVFTGRLLFTDNIARAMRRTDFVSRHRSVLHVTVVAIQSRHRPHA